MNVLLINPWEGEIFPTPAIGYIQGAIRDKLPEVNVMSADYFRALKILETRQFDLVAVTFHSFSVKHAKTIREKVKGRLICGGHHPSALPEQMLSIGYDQVVIGEGENSMIDILLGDKTQVLSDSGNHYKDINEFPFPDYDGLYWEGSMGMPIISSRGCPFGCNFCASTMFWDRKWRGRDAGNIIDEIRYHIKRNAIRTFMFEDDNFTLNNNRAIAVCNGIRANFKLTWQCASRADVLDDEEFCKLLYASGCRTVWLGVESLSEKSLERSGKKIKVDAVLRGIEKAEKAGIQTMSQFIIGLPGDTEADINETVAVMKKSKIKRRGTNIAWILPGTEIHKEAKKRGFDDNTFLISGAPTYTYEQDINTLNYWAYLINTA